MKKLLALLACAIGCSAYPTFKDVPIECGVEAQYDLLVDPMFMFDTVGDTGRGWTATDGSIGAIMTGAVAAIPGGRCGSGAALVIYAANNNEWGSLFGINNFGPRDASGYEGLSFWARAPLGSNTAFTLLFDDPNTNNPTATPVCPDEDGRVPPPDPDAGVCRPYCTDGGTSTGVTDSTGMIIPGSVTDAPEPDQCGNSYASVVVVSRYWRFYTIPFGAFHQGPTPNRVPNTVLTQTGSAPGTTLRTAQLMTLIFRLPKAVGTELWIDNLAFYRRATATGSDGGVDAPQM